MVDGPQKCPRNSRRHQRTERTREREQEGLQAWDHEESREELERTLVGYPKHLFLRGSSVSQLKTSGVSKV